MTTQTKLIIGGIVVVCVYLLGCYTGCKIAPSDVRIAPGAQNTVVKIVPGKDSLIYRSGTIKIVHDTIEGGYVNIRVDTVDRFTQCPPPDTIVQYPKWETSKSSVIPTLDPSVLLASFKPRGNTIEVWIGGEHDFLGGFGGQVSCELNLQNLGIANAVPFVEIGYLHSPHVSVGVKGKIWGIW